MCDSKANGGRRCPSCTPAARRAARAAKRAVPDATSSAPSGGLDLGDLGLEAVEPEGLEPSLRKYYEETAPFKFDDKLDPYSPYSSPQALLGEFGDMVSENGDEFSFPTLLAWVKTDENLTDDEARRRIQSTRLTLEERRFVRRYLDELPGNANTPEWKLRHLVECGSIKGVLGVTENPLAPPELLAQISKIQNPGWPMGYIAFALAAHTSTPGAVLARLAEQYDIENLDEYNWDNLAIAREIAMNPSAPPRVLEKFAACDMPEIWEIVAENPSAPLATLETILAKADTIAWGASLKSRVEARLTVTP